MFSRIQKPDIHQKVVFIDDHIVWYGSINLLSFGSSEESIIRLDSREITVKLAEIAGKNDTEKVAENEPKKLRRITNV
jgi:phosphatidylserine/phosphatidylglycerophosphate/cardiolipin synthase-like enzyme